MAGLIRSRQAGIQNDLSAGLSADLFVIDDLARYGINSQISALAYDPVQSLLAVGTRSSQFGPGQIYVFGQKRICVTLQLPPRGASVHTLQFCADKLVCLDSKHDVSVFSLEAKMILSSHSPPGVVTALCTDPMLDYALIGMQTGDVLAYDLDRESLTAFKIPNLWREVDPRARVSPIVCLQLHPKDIGTLLIGYSHGACIYSFKANKALKFYQYEVPRGAPGGDGNPSMVNTVRRPKLTQATWHPSGTFVMTGHEDSSIVFWDVLKDGRMLMARTRTDSGVATPGAGGRPGADPTDTLAVKEPIFRVAWCANGQNPDDTGILIAGGASTQAPTKGLCFLELGPTPIYATSGWDALAAHFDSPKRQRILLTPPGAEVVDFCLIPKTSPHFAGAYDPIAVIALLSSGELLTLSFPSGIPISPTNQLHPGLTFVHPFLQKFNVSAMDRTRWLGMTETRQQGPLILKGGAEGAYPMKRYENRNIVQAAHADGSVRLWDVGHGDEIENDRVLQVDVVRAVGRFDRVEVTEMSLAGATGELAVGLQTGELVIFRWARNRNAGKEPPSEQQNRAGQLTDVTGRVEASLTEGLLPFTLLDQQDGPVTAIKMSDVGFVAAGYEGGTVVVLDLRGPAVIFTASVQDFSRGDKHGPLRRRHSAPKPDFATHMEFSVMTLEGEEWSSILLHVGTHTGTLATLKIVPDASGRYSAQHVGSVALDGKVIHLHPINADSGKPAHASQHAVAALRSGARTNGALVAATPTGLHVSRPPTSRGAHRSFDSFFCDAAGVCRYQDAGHAAVTLSGDGAARAFSIPGLKELACVRVDAALDVRRLADAAVTPSGAVVGPAGPSELALVSVFGTGEALARPGRDALFNPAALIPPRPTIGAVAWVTGTQYVTPSDMDTLIGGPERPPSKRMIAQAQAEEAQRRAAGRPGATAAGQQDQGYWAYMQRQIQERTERLGIVGDSMDNLEQNSSNWLDDVNKFVGRQKRNAATGCESSSFFLGL